MYETEANFQTAPLAQIPVEGAAAFAGLEGTILTRTVLSWSEHCTECVWPTCYSSCDLYSPRVDGRCRRFVDGMVRVDCPASVNGYLLQIRFKQWGKLWTPGNLNLHAVTKASRIENRDFRFGTVLHQLPLPTAVRTLIVKKRYGLKKRLASRPVRDGKTPTAFLLECYNPTDQPVPLSLTFRAASRKDKVIPYQQLVHLAPGFQLVRIPFSEVANIVDLHAPFNIELIPNNVDQETMLYFGLMEFVEEVQQRKSQEGPIKCVVWDLDNTLWDGVITEDDPTALRLKSGILDVIESLDRGGILQSVASKNNPDEAMQTLRRLGIDHFFLYPQISWSPKGEAIQTIARHLNISTNAILFVDDSEFELQQVQSSCPGVRVLHADTYKTILEMRGCQVPLTKESGNRRKMYQVEQERQELARSFKDDYKAFLKDCSIKLTVTCLKEANLQRVHELTQRTNQMNFSGTRYDRDRLREILGTPHLDTYVLECEDRFGSYGIVGFGIVDRGGPLMTDLMFSCRIQAKRIEHAFLAHIIKAYLNSAGKDFYANYRKTPRNEPSGQVFADLTMQEIGVTDGVTMLMFPQNGVIPDDGIIEIYLNDNDHVGSKP